MQEQVLKQQCGSVWGRQVKPNSWSSQLQVQNRGYEGSVKCARALPQPAWPPLQVKHQNHQHLPHAGSGSRPVLQTGSAVKRGCAGTGVFLPRQYGAPPPEPRKKTSKNRQVLFDIVTFVYFFPFAGHLRDYVLCSRLCTCCGASKGYSCFELEH